MKFILWKRNLTIYSEAVTLSFTSLPNPVDKDLPVIIEAENAQDAADKACHLLKILGVETHSIRGNSVTIMSSFPDYFVGKLDTALADRYDTSSLMYQIETFTPVPKI